MPRAGRSIALNRVRLALTGCATVLALSGCGTERPASDSDSAFADLRAVRLATRPFAARLTGGFSHVPLASPTRGTADATAVDLRLAATRLEKRLSEDRGVTALVNYAAGALMTGHTSDAISALNEARRSAPEDARVLSDLAAAYLVRASESRTGPNDDHVRALDAASAAVTTQPSLAEAWFNRALAMNGILPGSAVEAAWRDFLVVEDGTGWANEARERLRVNPKVPVADIRSAGLEAVSAAAQANRQRAREAVLEEIAPEWATAVLAGRASDAAAQLRRIDVIGGALSAHGGDPFVQQIASQMRRPDETTSTARAWLTYARGRREYLAEGLADAQRTFDGLYSTLASDSPLRCWIGLQRATIAIDRRDIARARRVLEEPAQLARRAGYHAAEARALWLRGLVEHQSNEIDAALEDYARASSLYSDIGERENELAVYTATADNLRLRGERRRSWAYVLSVLARADELSTPIRRYLAYFNAALFAADEGWLRAALVFQDTALREAAQVPSSGPTFEALVSKARFQLRLDDSRGVAETLGRASSVLAQRGHDEYASAALDAVIGEHDLRTRPAAAEAPLTHAITFFDRAEPAESARLHLLRGRARRAAGDVPGAEADFSAGIANVEARRREIGSAQLRVTYLDDTADLFTEMADLQLSLERDADTAFAVVERGRARTLADATRAPVLSISALERELPDGVVVLEYKLLHDSVACWVVTRTGHRTITIPASPAALDAAVGRFMRLLQEQGTRSYVSEARALYGLLIAPVETDIGKGRTLVVVADGALTRLPFAALLSPLNRFVIENHAVVMMPSAASFAGSVGRASSMPRESRSALLVGEPAVDEAVFPGLAPLPGARAEAHALVPLYAEARPLTSVAATRGAFLAALPAADVVHFAGHAVANGDNPDLSALILAPAPGDPSHGALRGADISKLRLPRTRLVVLAACETADGPVTRGEGVHSLARPFLDAGVPSVVATLWKIDDGLSADLFRRLHERFRYSNDVGEALRDSQLAMLAAGGAGADPRVWAGVIALGATGRASHKGDIR